MPRPPRCRRLFHQPAALSFGPLDGPGRGQVELTLEGLEALRHSDLEELDHAEAAELMGVSRQTYGRILAGARRAVAEALCQGAVLRVQGGNHRWAAPEEARRFRRHGNGWGGGRGRRGR